MSVTCAGVGKTFVTGRGELVALRDLTFTSPPHEFLCVVGPSGCGKTTLLKLLAGLATPTTGTVQIEQAGSEARPAMVFQDHGLFPWLTVEDNVAFGLEARGVRRRERHAAARTALATVGLSGFEDAYPDQLSGGMQQRAGIARALAIEPTLLLMDEPFGALDAQTRRVLQDELLRLWRRDRQQVVYVTHDIDEAVRLADRVLVLSGRPGAVIADLPVDLPRPRSADVAMERAVADLRWRIWTLLEPEVRHQVGVPV